MRRTLHGGPALSQHSNSIYGFIFQIFIWIGKDANEVEKTESLKSGKLDINYSEIFKFTYFFLLL